MNLWHFMAFAFWSVLTPICGRMPFFNVFLVWLPLAQRERVARELRRRGIMQ